jgi:tetratricopeptide (TPR) repeat protein
MRTVTSLVSASILWLGFAPGSPADLSAQSIWPERAQNLQVLPEDFPPQRLRAVMQGFSGALGVRCSHCHVGEEGAPLTTYDFVSDENPNKDRARAMYRMLGIINQELKSVEPSGPTRVNMWCHTCHNGKPRPQTLDEAVMERHGEAGGDSAMAHFVALRARYYGSSAYDFSAASVDGLAGQLLEVGDTATALRFFERNVEDHPDFVDGWASLGDLAVARGESDAARRLFERALALDPENPRIRRSLDAIR